VQLWEIDHPATQHHKVRTFSKIGAERLHFVAMDLSATAFDGEALIKNSFDPTQRAVWIAEGLLMYLTLERVSSLMRTLKSLSAPAVRFFDHDDLRELKSGMADEPLAKGEVICLAET
jgi:O-methyltransferase involved in polyketide biosynthesis